MSPAYQNRHGRKPGRGLRPWLLVPKFIAVAMYLGGLAAVGAILLAGGERGREQWAAVFEHVALVFDWIIIPGISAAVALGIGLVLLHGRVMLRMRWLQAKIALAAVCIPPLHFFGHETMEHVEHELRAGEPDGPTGLIDAFVLIVGAAIVFGLVMMWLGRYKPRLGQRPKAVKKPGA